MNIVDLRKNTIYTICFVLISIAMILFLVTPGCSTGSKTIGSASTSLVSRLRLLDIHELPHGLSFRGTTVGGLSGIDYDQKRDLYYMISDDRSDINLSRFYVARILMNKEGIDSIGFLDVVTLLDKNKKPYANQQEDPFRRTDPEGIRYDPTKDILVWSNEGERTVINGKLVLCDPSVTIVDREGQYLDSFALPSNMHVHAGDKGIRRNGAFEGLSFDDTHTFLYLSVEEPLYEDGDRAGLHDSTAWIRFIKFDAATKKQVAQYAYQLGAIPYPATPADAFKVNGVSEILYIGKNKLLVIERSFSTGRRPSAVRLYIADLADASDVAAVPSLLQTGSYKPVSKKLLLNMDELGPYIDNVEGVCFGPELPNGNATLIFISDDNFSPGQRTQFFLFEVIP